MIIQEQPFTKQALTNIIVLPKTIKSQNVYAMVDSTYSFDTMIAKHHGGWGIVNKCLIICTDVTWLQLDVVWLPLSNQ